MASRVSWDQALSPCYFPKSPPPPIRGTSLFERFADEIAEHDDIAAACVALRIAPEVGQSFLRRLEQEAGEQAQ